MVYGQYVLLECNGNSVVFCNDGTSLDLFKSSNDMVIQGRRTTMIGDQPHIPMLQGELDPEASYNIAMEISKKMTHSLIMELRQIEAEGKYLVALVCHQMVRLS